MATIFSQPIRHFGLILCSILLQLLLSAIERTACCSLPPEWKRKEIRERMREATAEIVIKGIILKKNPTENIPSIGGDVYSARIQVLCVYKGPIVNERVTVTGFGRTPSVDHCVTTNVREGSTYFIIMMPFEDRYRIVEVNLQIAAKGWSPRGGPLIESGYTCQDPYTLPPTTPMPTTKLMTTEDMTLMTTKSGGCKSCSMYYFILVACCVLQTNCS